MSHRGFGILIKPKYAMPPGHPLRIALASLSCLFGIFQASSLYAQTYGQVAAGHNLARTWCSGCHLISPKLTTGKANGAPSFSSIADMTSTTSMSLNAFLQTSHRQMPNFELTRTQIADVTAYILSLKSVSDAASK